MELKSMGELIGNTIGSEVDPGLLNCRVPGGIPCPSLRVGVRQAVSKARCGLQGLSTDLIPLLNLEIGNVTLERLTRYTPSKSDWDE